MRVESGRWVSEVSALRLLGLVGAIALGAACIELPGQNNDADGSGGSLGGDAEGWQVLGTHPCLEYRVDAMLVEQGGEQLWLGCGSGSTGYGLFHSDDGGASWDLARTEPHDYFATFRVNDIKRGADGLLYVAGAQHPGSDMAVRVDTDASPFAVSSILGRGTQHFASFQVGGFQIDDDGWAIAVSLTGTDLMVREHADADFAPAQDWSSTGRAFQILGTALHEGVFYGSGSTIADTFRLFLPAHNSGDAFQLDVLGFEGTRGELWGLAIDASGIAAAGVEQRTNHAAVVTGPLDGRTEADFFVHDLRPVLRQDAPSRLYGVCRQGERILALGDYSTRSHGLALLSTDNGASFREVTTGEESNGGPSPILDRCAFLDDSTVVIAGGQGFVARFSLGSR